jgi:hypothetical protein
VSSLTTRREARFGALDGRLSPRILRRKALGYHDA